MKIVEIEQSTPEWLIWRQSKITATDAACITGSNVWTNPNKLWKEKLGIIPRQEENDAMRRGKLLEPEARELFNKMASLNMIPVCCEHSEYPWMAASLDGFDGYYEKTGWKYILEIKCPKIATHEAAIEGTIPFYYQDQMQHQLAVTGAELCFFASYFPGHSIPLHIIEVKPNVYRMQEIITKELDFYENYLCAFREPEESSFKFKLKAI